MNHETYMRAPEMAADIHTQNESKIHRRELLEDGRLEIICENGSRFYLEEIRSPEAMEVAQFHQLLKKTFNANEVDSPEFQQSATLENDKEESEKNFDFYLKVLKNESGEVIGGMQASSSPAKEENGNKLGWSVGFGHYIVIEQTYRKLGLAQELYADFYTWGESRAQQRGENLKIFLGEVVPSNERNFEKDHGGGRLFLDIGETLEEIKYYQPPLDFDKATGEPKGDAVAEHLMLGRVGLNKTASPEKSWTVKKEEVLACVRAIYEIKNVFPVTRDLARYKDFWQDDNIEGDPSVVNPLKKIKSYYEDLKSQMDGASDQVYILDSSVRKYCEHYMKNSRFKKIDHRFTMGDMLRQYYETQDVSPDPIVPDLERWTRKPHTSIEYHSAAERTGTPGGQNAYL